MAKVSLDARLYRGNISETAASRRNSANERRERYVFPTLSALSLISIQHKTLVEQVAE